MINFYFQSVNTVSESALNIETIEFYKIHPSHKRKDHMAASHNKLTSLILQENLFEIFKYKLYSEHCEPTGYTSKSIWKWPNEIPNTDCVRNAVQ